MAGVISRFVVHVLGLTLMLVALMTAAGGTAAQGDVCVGIHGDTKIGEGDSTCYSNETSRAIAVNGGNADALFD